MTFSILIIILTTLNCAMGATYMKAGEVVREMQSSLSLLPEQKAEDRSLRKHKRSLELPVITGENLVELHDDVPVRSDCSPPPYHPVMGARRLKRSQSMEFPPNF